MYNLLHLRRGACGIHALPVDGAGVVLGRFHVRCVLGLLEVVDFNRNPYPGVLESVEARLHRALPQSTAEEALFLRLRLRIPFGEGRRKIRRHYRLGEVVRQDDGIYYFRADRFSEFGCHNRAEESAGFQENCDNI